MIDSDNRPIAISHLRTKMGLGILYNCPTYLLSWIESAIDVFQYELSIKTLPNTDKYNLIRKCHLSFWESSWSRSRVRALRCIYRDGHQYRFPVDIDIPISFVHNLAEQEFWNTNCG